VFPSVTRASAAAVATGHLPGSHGLHGNRMCFLVDGRLEVRDAGLPDFREHMRRAIGCALRVPACRHRANGSAATASPSPTLRLVQLIFSTQNITGMSIIVPAVSRREDTYLESGCTECVPRSRKRSGNDGALLRSIAGGAKAATSHLLAMLAG